MFKETRYNLILQSWIKELKGKLIEWQNTRISIEEAELILKDFKKRLFADVGDYFNEEVDDVRSRSSNPYHHSAYQSGKAKKFYLGEFDKKDNRYSYVFLPNIDKPEGYTDYKFWFSEEQIHQNCESLIAECQFYLQDPPEEEPYDYDYFRERVVEIKTVHDYILIKKDISDYLISDMFEIIGSISTSRSFPIRMYRHKVIRHFVGHLVSDSYFDYLCYEPKSKTDRYNPEFSYGSMNIFLMSMETNYKIPKRINREYEEAEKNNYKEIDKILETGEILI